MVSPIIKRGGVHRHLMVLAAVGLCLQGLDRVLGHSWIAPSWLQIPTGTSWSMLHEVRIPFGKTSISLALPVKYKFDNESTLSIDSTGRSGVINDEQEDIFNTIEDTLRGFGLDGKSCLLRAICEINESPVRDLTLIGEILTVILRPRRTFQQRSFLLEYLKAEDVGRQKGNCWKNYYGCPFSLRHFLSRLQYVR